VHLFYFKKENKQQPRIPRMTRIFSRKGAKARSFLERACEKIIKRQYILMQR